MLLVGGSSRIPLVAELLGAATGRSHRPQSTNRRRWWPRAASGWPAAAPGTTRAGTAGRARQRSTGRAGGAPARRRYGRRAGRPVGRQRRPRSRSPRSPRSCGRPSTDGPGAGPDPTAAPPIPRPAPPPPGQRPHRPRPTHDQARRGTGSPPRARTTAEAADVAGGRWSGCSWSACSAAGAVCGPAVPARHSAATATPTATPTTRPRVRAGRRCRRGCRPAGRRSSTTSRGPRWSPARRPTAAAATTPRPGVLHVTRDQFDVSGCVAAQYVQGPGGHRRGGRGRVRGHARAAPACGCAPAPGATSWRSARTARSRCTSSATDPPSTGTPHRRVRGTAPTPTNVVVGLVARGSDPTVLTVYVDGVAEPDVTSTASRPAPPCRPAASGWADSPRIRSTRLDATITRFRAWTPSGAAS